jgi:hypothetical protein
VAGRYRQTALLAALALLAPEARADRWVVENSLLTRLEANDNVNLVAHSPGIVNTLSVSTNLSAAREVESASTRANLALTALHQVGPGAQDRVDGQAGLSQALTEMRHTWNGQLAYRQDFNNTVVNSDLGVGYGRRRETQVAGGWSYALSERLSAGLQASFGQTTYGVPGAENFRTDGVGANGSWLMSERIALNARIGRVRFRTLDGSSTSTTDDANIGWTRSFSELGSGSVSVGVYRTTHTTLLHALACPLPALLCTSGIVPFVPVTVQADFATHGVQFSASYRFQLDERSSVGFTAARLQQPSGVGAVLRNDSITASASRGLSPVLDGSVAYAYSHSTSPLPNDPSPPPQQRVSAALFRRLGPDLALRASYDFTRAAPTATSALAQSNAIAVTLEYAWPRVDVH